MLFGFALATTSIPLRIIRHHEGQICASRLYHVKVLWRVELDWRLSGRLESFWLLISLLRPGCCSGKEKNDGNTNAPVFFASDCPPKCLLIQGLSHKIT